MSWRITPTGPASLGLLDQHGGAAAAYSLRNLSIYNTSPVVRVRRSSDNAEADFTAAQVSDGTLAAWVGAGNNGFVRTWYDQSGNGRHAAQTDTACQPQIISNSGLILEGSKPSLQFDDLDDFLAPLSGLTGLARLDAFAVKNSTSSGHLTFNATGTGSNFSWAAEQSSSNAGTHQWKPLSGSPILYVNGTLNSPSTRGEVYTALNGYKIETTINGGTVAWSGFRIAGYGLIFAYGGTMQEVILYASDQSSNRVAIETSINAHYSIF
jgi:hypothetical protein